jgi:gliding motility-associated-like protein
MPRPLFLKLAQATLRQQLIRPSTITITQMQHTALNLRLSIINKPFIKIGIKGLKWLLILVFMCIGAAGAGAQNAYGGHITATLDSSSDISTGAKENLYDIKLYLSQYCRERSLDSVPVRLYDQVTLEFISTIWLTTTYSGIYSYNTFTRQFCQPTSHCFQSLYFRKSIKLPTNRKRYLISYGNGKRYGLQNTDDSSFDIICSFTNGTNSVLIRDEQPSHFCNNDTIRWAISTFSSGYDSLSFILSAPVKSRNQNQFSAEKINYKNGYSAEHPLGDESYVKLDPVSGLLTIKSDDTGIYAFHVTVIQYDAQKNIMGLCGFDMSIDILDCSGYLEPAIEKYEPYPVVCHIEAGDTANIHFGLYYSPPYSEGYYGHPWVLTDFVGFKPDQYYPLRIRKDHDLTDDSNNLYVSIISFRPFCENVRKDPYRIINRYFYGGSTDSGWACKESFSDFIFLIYVDPVKKPFISGDTLLCFTKNEIQKFEVDKNNKDSIVCFVEGGRLISQTNKNLFIKWDGIGNHLLKVVAFNKWGCHSDTALMRVKLYSRPSKAPISGPVSACAGSQLTYTTGTEPGIKHIWILNDGIRHIIDTSESIQYYIENNTCDSLTVKMVALNGNSCTADTSILITKIYNNLDKIEGYATACPNSMAQYHLSFAHFKNTRWKVTGGKITSVSAISAFITVKWNGGPAGMVSAICTDSPGCSNDSLVLSVSIKDTLDPVHIIGESHPCPYQKEEYQVDNDTNMRFVWKINGGFIVSQRNNKVIVAWDNAGKGQIICYRISFDTLNHSNCYSLADTFQASINYFSMPPMGITGPDSVCINNTNLFILELGDTLSYDWFIDSALLASHSHSINSIFSTAGRHTINVNIYSAKGCLMGAFEKKLTVIGNDTTGKISGPDNICFTDRPQQYFFSGANKSSYKWTVVGGYIKGFNDQSSVEVIWYPSRSDYKLSLVGKSWANCTVDTFNMPVYIKNMNMELDYVSDKNDADSGIYLYWKVNRLQLANKYIYVFRSTSNGIYSLIDSALYRDGKYLDKDINQRIKYSYEIRAKNKCGAFEASNKESNILLDKSDLNDSAVLLTWTKYNKMAWKQSVVRIIKDQDLLRDTIKVTTNDTLYERISENDYRECYRIGSRFDKDTTKISWSNRICIYNPLHIFFPNAFSPNNDGINDTYRVSGFGVKNFSIRIYNRWGEMIYSSESFENSWDGKFHGSYVEDGIYFYVAYAAGNTVKRYFSGNIQILK